MPDTKEDLQDLSRFNRIRALECWTSQISVARLHGGITNHNYLITDQHSRYVARVGDDIPEHMISRANELAAAKAAHAAGLSPRIVHHEDGVLVMDYLDAKPLTPNRIRQTGTLTRVIDLIRRCHFETPVHLRGPAIMFWVFHVIREYASGLKAAGSRYTGSLQEFLRVSETLEDCASPFEIVFAHNDLLAANLLDDGHRLWMIDWEYAGYNSPLFDLGGLASNNELDEAQERWMLEQYFSDSVSQDLWLKYHAMKCASLLRETLWSMVSEIHSTLDFDYSQYTQDNLDRYRQALAFFDRLSKTVAK